VVVRPELERLADPIQAMLLRLGERRVGGGEDGGRVHHRLVEIEREEVVAEVVVRRDVPARRALAVPRHPPDRPLKGREDGVETAPPAIEPAHVPDREANQPDQVVAVPDAVAVGLAETDAPTQHRPVEVRRVDLDRRLEL
jgi:hypothetical protein